jgi:two-component system, LytTR family, sensor kinase
VPIGESVIYQDLCPVQYLNKTVRYQLAIWLGIFAIAATLGTPFGRPEGFYWLMFFRLIAMVILFNTIRYGLIGFYLKNQKILFISLALLCLLGFVTSSALLEYAMGFSKVIASSIPAEWQHKTKFLGVIPGFLIVPSTLIGLVIAAAAVSSGISSAFEQKKEEEAAANRRRLEAELALLKSQINPHFLLNSLNNLYALALTQPEKTPSALLKLSEMVAYILHECDRPKVPLVRDLQFVENYIALQRLRLPPNIILSVEMPDRVPDLHIEPMILISFIENAFKHGLTTKQPSHVSINLQIEGNSIALTVENPIIPNKNDVQVSGIGIANTTMRLQHAYPEQHHLIIHNNGSIYRVELKITLN